MSRVRMDKWLWATRFFKTRALAVKACEMGRIECQGTSAKASREVRVGDVLQVTSDGSQYTVTVLVLSEVRGPGALAATYYEESEASRLLRLKVAEARKAMAQLEPQRDGKISKRDRRDLDRVRGR